MNNSTQLVEREIASGAIEGVNFGPKVWVVVRSPLAVLLWVYGHSWSVNGHQSYAEPHLTLLPDRSPRFMHRPVYKNFPVKGNRLRISAISSDALVQIGGAFDIRPGQGWMLVDAITRRKTLLLDGGGNQLLPLALYGEAYRDWRAIHGTGFVMLPEGMSEHEACRGKLGWKPSTSG